MEKSLSMRDDKVVMVASASNEKVWEMPWWVNVVLTEASGEVRADVRPISSISTVVVSFVHTRFNIFEAVHLSNNMSQDVILEKSMEGLMSQVDL